jgi:uncharacterized protein YciI
VHGQKNSLIAAACLNFLMKLLILLGLFTLSHYATGQSKSYTIAFLNKKSDAEQLTKEAVDKLMEGHMANINRLASEGKLLAAGPFAGGGGLFIFNTVSADEARSWVESDPAVKANRWNIEILGYTPRTGSVCPVTEPYQMVSYTFVRFNAIVEKHTASTFPVIMRNHDKYVKQLTDTSKVITEAIFGPNEGGILILQRELPSGAFDDDPGVRQGLLDVQIKKLYIARGSFCERAN